MGWVEGDLCTSMVALAQAIYLDTAECMLEFQLTIIFQPHLSRSPDNDAGSPLD